MSDDDALLLALQHGDSFFPSGSIAFSWGLETLRAEGVIASAADLQRFATGQLTRRWASCDRPALAAAHAAGGDLDRVREVDRAVEALTLAREMREGSRRGGATLLGVHEALGTPGAAVYRRSVRSGEAPGHLAAVQGLVWRGVDLPQEAAAAISAHGLSIGLLGAALRLGLIGHLEAQRILACLRPVIRRLLARPPAPLRRLAAFAPEAEIAAMRHETASLRLFAN